jgi:hypothetical protein
MEAFGLEDRYFKKAPVLGPSGIVVLGMLGTPMLKGIAQRKNQLDFYQIFTFFYSFFALTPNQCPCITVIFYLKR